MTTDVLRCQRPGCGVSVAIGASVSIGCLHESFRLCVPCYSEYSARKLLALDAVLRTFMAPPPAPIDLAAFARSIANP
jgi:hypothetical protein